MKTYLVRAKFKTSVVHKIMYQANSVANLILSERELEVFKENIEILSCREIGAPDTETVVEETAVENVETAETEKQEQKVAKSAKSKTAKKE